MPDLNHVRAGYLLYLRSIDEYGNVSVTEVVAKGTRGRNLILEDVPGGFCRSTGEMNGIPQYGYLPGARSVLMERTPENVLFFERAKAGLVPPVVPLAEAKLRKAVGWLKNLATYDQVVAVIDQSKLLQCCGPWARAS